MNLKLPRFFSLTAHVTSIACCCIFFLFTTNAIAQNSYSLIDLGDFPDGSDYSAADAVNDQGEVVGSSSALDGQRGFYWTPDNGMVDMGILPNGVHTYGTSLNNHGRAVGLVIGPSIHSFIWDLQNGIVEIGNLGVPLTMAHDINDSGFVVGRSHSGTAYRAFIWDEVNGMIDIGVLSGGTPGHGAEAHAINESGKVVGFSATNKLVVHAFIWDPENGMVDLGAFPDGNGYSFAYDINGSGQVVGKSHMSDVDEYRAAIWNDNSGMTNLGALPGTTGESQALGINDSGIVVGSSGGINAQRAFVWDANNGMTYLKDLVDESGSIWILSSANDINSLGQIVGWGLKPGNIRHAFLLTPKTFAPQTLDVLSGVIQSGGNSDLSSSDNNDLSIVRDVQSIQSQVVVLAKIRSPVENPNELTFTLESSVFARGDVQQTIELFNYESDEFEMFDSRTASRFSDQIVTVTPSGDFARFVEPGTRCLEARVSYFGANRRLQFSANIDHLVWQLE